MNAPISRRTLLMSGAGIAGATMLTACGSKSSTSGGSSNATKDKIKVGYIADGNGATLSAVANHLKLWDKHGLDPDLKTFTNGPLQIQALGTGDLDFGYIGSGALWLPMSGKAKVVAIQSLGTAERIIAKEGTASFADLKGKTVGVPEGTSGDMVLNLALEKNGMTMSDIKRTPMDPSTVVSSFISGQIDAAAIWYPHVATIKARVPNLVELVKSTDFPELAFPACQVAGVKITERAAVLKKFQALCKEAFEWAATHRDELTGLLAQTLKADKQKVASEQEFTTILRPSEVIAKDKDGTVGKWLSTLNQLYVKNGKVTEVTDPKTYYLASEYEKA